MITASKAKISRVGPRAGEKVVRMPRKIPAMATVAIAGVFLAIRTTFSPSVGPARLIFGFEAVIIGGLGSLWGTLLGGIVLGVAQAVGAQVSSGWGVLTGHLVFLAVLALRPTGLFPRTAPA